MRGTRLPPHCTALAFHPPPPCFSARKPATSPARWLLAIEPDHQSLSRPLWRAYLFDAGNYGLPLLQIPSFYSYRDSVVLFIYLLVCLFFWRFSYRYSILNSVKIWILDNYLQERKEIFEFWRIIVLPGVIDSKWNFIIRGRDLLFFLFLDLFIVVSFWNFVSK